ALVKFPQIQLSSKLAYRLIGFAVSIPEKLRHNDQLRLGAGNHRTRGSSNTACCQPAQQLRQSHSEQTASIYAVRLFVYSALEGRGNHLFVPRVAYKESNAATNT